MLSSSTRIGCGRRTSCARSARSSLALYIALVLLFVPAQGLSLMRKTVLVPPSLQTKHVICNRQAFLRVAALGWMTASTKPAQALDIDSFLSEELSKPKAASPSQKMSDDEALCKFGQPSKERGDACVRVGLPTTLKKGGVDAYGNVDRGNFTRCKIVYVDDPNAKGFLMKQTVCE